MKIGFIGCGSVGGSLANVLQADGHDVAVGLRYGREKRADATYRVAAVADAVQNAEVVFVALPYDALATALSPLTGALSGKIVVDVSNPVNGDWSPKLLGEDNSAGEETQRLLPRSKVLKAFKHDLHRCSCDPTGSAGTGSGSQHSLRVTIVVVPTRLPGSRAMRVLRPLIVGRSSATLT